MLSLSSHERGDMSNGRSIVRCTICKQDKTLEARGLCKVCYNRQARQGKLRTKHKTTRTRRAGTACIRCGKSPVKARALCGKHYQRLRRAHGIGSDDVPSQSRSLDDVLEDWDWMRRSGETKENAAHRLGMTVRKLEEAVRKGVLQGDPRATFDGTRK